ncbi:MAG: hypothetical protein JNL70_17015 [Saprospiraceae bacterium]|nr:hypothetical protein [Saprospiraceae bacterium]
MVRIGMPIGGKIARLIGAKVKKVSPIKSILGGSFQPCFFLYKKGGFAYTEGVFIKQMGLSFKIFFHPFTFATNMEADSQG